MLTITVAITLAIIVIQYVDGNQGVGHVNELFSDDKGFNTSIEGDNGLECGCNFDNHSCDSLDDKFANLYNNIVINITSDAVLSSISEITNLKNVLIIGYNNPTVRCRNGGIHFTSCHNCIIEGIIWDQCGTRTKPVLKLTNSSNVTVKNCSFQYSKGQVILLSRLSGTVNIDRCNFVHNNQYSGHGSVIHYLSSNTAESHPQLLFTIKDCKFTYNEGTKSLVYMNENGTLGDNTNIFLQSSKFCHNQGISVYLIYQRLNLNGEVLFQNNSAENGVGIYIGNHSTVACGENLNLTFFKNSATYRGGAIFLTHYSSVTFNQNSVITFNDNNAVVGTIYSEFSSHVAFDATCNVTFSRNYISDYGAAIYSSHNSIVTFTGTSRVKFNSNIVHKNFDGCNGRPPFGGIIYSINQSNISFRGNSTTLFNGNIANYGGGAILSYKHSSIVFEETSTVVFTKNTAKKGGAIYSYRQHIAFKGSSTIQFSDNSASHYGGALLAADHSNITFDDSSTIHFTNNKAPFGATVYSSGYSKITAREKSTVTFNSRLAKWSIDKCLLNSSQRDVATIDITGIVKCIDPNTFICQSKQCYHSKNFEDLLHNLNKTNALVNVSDIVILSSIKLLKRFNSISIIGHNNSIVLLVHDGRLNIKESENVSIKGITWIGHKNDNILKANSLIYLQGCSNIAIQNCFFSHLTGQAVAMHKVSGDVNINQCNFANNIHHSKQGSALYVYYRSGDTKSTFMMDNCSFNYNVAAKSVVYIGKSSCEKSPQLIHFDNCSFCNSQGVPVLLSNCLELHISGEVLFENNIAENGAGIYINKDSGITFGNNSNVTFLGNSVKHSGSALFLHSYSSVIFESNSRVAFNDNKATNGTIYSETSSNVLFKATSEVTFNSNSVTQCGACIYSSDNCDVIFTRDAKVTFSNNVISVNNETLFQGGVIYMENYGHISFEENSVTIFTNNSASFGAAILLTHNSNITFKDRSKIFFNENRADYNGGAIALYDNCIAAVTQFSELTFSNNFAKQSGGALQSSDHCHFLFADNSVTSFTNNSAKDYGGGVHSRVNSHIEFAESSTVVFKNNTALFGEILYSNGNSVITTNSNVTIKINSNTPTWSYGNQLTYESDDITINTDGIVRCSNHKEYYTCINNTCHCGNIEDISNNVVVAITETMTLSKLTQLIGLVNISLIGYNDSSIHFVNDGRLHFTSCSNLTITNLTFIKKENDTSSNITPQLKFYGSSNITIQRCSFQHSAVQAVELSEVSGDVNINYCNFVNNTYSHRIHSAAIRYTSNESDAGLVFMMNSCSFNNNKAAKSLIYTEQFHYTSPKHISVNNCSFHGNQGGSIHLLGGFNLTINGEAMFENNVAENGVGIYISKYCNVTFGNNANVKFINNSANHNGAALFISDHSSIIFESNSRVEFNDNKATNGTIYSEASSNVIFQTTSEVTFNSNSATQCGACICSSGHSDVLFTRDAKVTFINNVVSVNNETLFQGGAIYMEHYGHISFEENSVTMFTNNSASFGAAILLIHNSNITFKDRSKIFFNENRADYNGGAIALYDNCIAAVTQFSNLTFSNNFAKRYGGGQFLDGSRILFADNSSISFINNTAKDYGGAVYSKTNSSIIFAENSTVVFKNNTALFGETLYSNGNSVATTNSNATIKINSNIPTWSYGDQLTYESDDITINTDGTVRCSNHKEYYTCINNTCHCQNIEDISNNAVVAITETMTLYKLTQFIGLVNISLIGYNDSYVEFINDGGLQFTYCSNLTITNLTFIKKENNISSNTTPQLKFYGSSNITIQRCSFQHSIVQAVELSEISGDVNINHCKFINNTYSQRIHGAAIRYTSNCTTDSKSRLTINDCHFGNNLGHKNLISLEGNNNDTWCGANLYNSKFNNNQGGCIYLSEMDLYIKRTISFIRNAAENGTGIFINDHSKVTFDNNADARFSHNTADINGGAIYLANNSSIIFENNLPIEFLSNKAKMSGGIVYCQNSKIILKGSKGNLTIHRSKATHGGAFYLIHNSSMMVTENSTIEFINNNAKADGGAIYLENYSSIVFKSNSKIKFLNTKAKNSGGSIYSHGNSEILLEDYSSVRFSNATAELGGSICAKENSFITTRGSSKLTINNVEAINGGAVYLYNSSMTTTGNSTIVLFNNKARTYGGSIHSDFNSIVMFKGNSVITLNSSRAIRGGAIYSRRNSMVKFENNSRVTCTSSTATQNGGCISSEDDSKIQFKGNTVVVFNNSVVYNGAGGAVYCAKNSSVYFEGNSKVKFDRNTVYNGEGGAVCCKTSSFAIFKGKSNVTFDNNKATDGGAANYYNSSLIIRNICSVKFNNNSATTGGAISFHSNSSGTFENDSTLILTHNYASKNGGAFYLHGNSYIEFVNQCQSNETGLSGLYCSEHSYVTNIVLTRNNADEKGGAIFSEASEVLFKNNSFVIFKENKALQDGGAVYLSDQSNLTFMRGCNITFSDNVASDYGGAMYADMVKGKINFNTTNILFHHNTAGAAGDSVYINLPKHCNSACLNDSVHVLCGISVKDPQCNKNIGRYIVTSPNRIKLYHSKVKCTKYSNDTECITYFIDNIMLGQKIFLDACTYDYYGKPTDTARFLISSTSHQSKDYIVGSNNTLITCNHTVELANVYGNKNFPFNYSINLTLHDNRQSESKEVFTTLTIGLSTCHPGFWYHEMSQKCECYNDSDIVFCSGSTSTIKRGYWFGNVTGKPTVTFCPINYCKFSCCEASNGYYQLSPARDNQCTSHRSGAACGTCTYGYTLSFDSAECVDTKNCTTDQTILVILLSVIYWIVMVALVFAVMYYKVGIGYLYSITYYYSIVDVLLNQNSQFSRELNLTMKIISSFSKITPEFLGELCLTHGMSGIDQQFIHYIHPSAVILILIIICLLARKSVRVSGIISRGIIRVICLLLLLSYTSIASTSLLLMRPLKFSNVAEVYTYLSPSIKYFHGRHLAYNIVALLCTTSIVIGLPLLLTLEPFLNRKFNFTKLKPLLDQFQGCYKDKYRCFAGYYMICRLVIITIVITNSTNGFVANYLLITVCGLIALMHLITKPYSDQVLNKLDGIVLQLIIFIAVLPLFSDYDLPVIITIAFVLVILPLLIFILMGLFLHKECLKEIAIRFITKDDVPCNNDANGSRVSTDDFYVIVDDSMRKNATICDV